MTDRSINANRLTPLIETSVRERIAQVAAEPDRSDLRERLTREVRNFLEGLFVAGALRGANREEAYFVEIETVTISQSDVDQGIGSIVVGFAPDTTAEFVIIRIGQWKTGADDDSGHKR